MYNYEDEKAAIFTEEGQKQFLKIRDQAKRLLETSGAARCQEIIAGCTGDSWAMLACVDRLVELGEIKELTKDMKVAGQHRVYIAA
ncbi:MAG: hypothetical protein ACJA2A_002085 [Cycloclasticus pugetii]|jgi:hypothetical protein